MKKVLSTALALGLVAGVATTASAAFDSFSISGYYMAIGKYGNPVDNSTGSITSVNLGTAAGKATGTGGGEEAGAWFEHNLRLYPTLNINDKTKLVGEVRLLDDTVWGAGTAAGSAGVAGTSTATQNRRGVDINKLYMQYMSPAGKLQVGRTPWGTYGTTKFLDSAGRNDAIKFWPSFMPANTSMILVYSKLTEGDAGPTAQDQDSDFYGLYLGYKKDAINTGARLFTTQNRNASTTQQNNDWQAQAYIGYKMDNYFFNAHGAYSFGGIDHESTAASDIDDDAWAFMAQAGGTFDALTVTGTFWHISGDDSTNANSNTDDNEAYGDAGNDWQPLMIMTGEDAGILNNKQDANNAGWMSSAVQTAGANMLMLQAAYKASDKLTLTGVVGGGWAADELGTRPGDSYGFEVDAGFSYKLLDNLTYSANFGYWDAGDFFTDGAATGTTDDSAENSAIMAVHALNMTF